MATRERERDQDRRHEVGQGHKFKYIGAVVLGDGLKPGVLSRITQATALTRLKLIWTDNSIPFGSEVKMMRSFVIFLSPYTCESWTLTPVLD